MWPLFLKELAKFVVAVARAVGKAVGLRADGRDTPIPSSIFGKLRHRRAVEVVLRPPHATDGDPPDTAIAFNHSSAPPKGIGPRYWEALARFGARLRAAPSPGVKRNLMDGAVERFRPLCDELDSRPTVRQRHITFAASSRKMMIGCSPKLEDWTAPTITPC